MLSGGRMRPVASAARRAVLVWGAWVTVAVLGIAAWSVLTLAVLLGTPLLALLTSGLAVSSVMYLVRLLPKPASATAEVLPSAAEAEALSSWLATYGGGWRPEIRLVAVPDVWVEGGVLKLGLPLVTTLHDTELLVLLRDARAQQEADASSRGVALALRLLAGRVGRTPGGPTRTSSARVDRMVFGSIYRHLGRVADQRRAETEARRAGYGATWEQAARRASLAHEGWQVLVDEWLEPALRQQVWYDEPFSTLRLFLDACTLSGLLDEAERLPGGDAPLDLSVSEHALARHMVQHVLGEDVPAGRWEEHPTDVTLERWRQTLAHGVQAASLMAGRPVSAAPGDLVRVVAHGEVALGVALGGQPDEESDDPVDELLVSLAAVALVDSGRAGLSWEWPRGTVLRDAQGEPLDLEAVVTDRHGLLDWLVGRGVDPDVPLWLSEGMAPGPERVVYAFNGRCDRSRRERRVLLTDRALRVFPAKVSWWRGVRAALLSENDPAAWDTAWAAVEEGTVPDGVRTIPWADVVDAHLVPDLRDSDRWRLRLRTEDGATQVRGLGVAQASTMLDELLGARFRVVGPPRLEGLGWRFLRLAAACVGGMLAILGTLFAVSPTPPMPRGAATVLAALALLVATSPITLRLQRVRRSEREHAWSHDTSELLLPV